MSVRPAPDGYLEVQDGDQWRRLRLISDVTFSSTPAPETSETTLDEGETSTIGSPGFPTYSVTVLLNDASRAYRLLENAFYSKETVNMRQFVGNRSVNTFTPPNNSRLVITAAGAVTGSGGLDFGTKDAPNSPWIPGRLLIPGKNRNEALAENDEILIIEDIVDSTHLVVTRVGKITTVASGSRPGNFAICTPDEVAITAIAGDNAKGLKFQLADYQVRTSWGGRVTQAGAPSRSGTTRNETIQGNCEARPTKVYLV